MKIKIIIPILLLLLTFMTPDALAQDERGTTPDGFSSCDVPGVGSTALCGTIEVFEDRQRKSGRKISLNIVVLKAMSENPKPDPLIVLVGGPGQDATRGASGFAQRYSAILENRDIVLVDQRGTGKSNGLKCDLGGAAGTFGAFVAGRFDEAEVSKCKTELEKIADLSLYTTEHAMDDLDEVRARLGYERINIYGGSYGTRPALIFARRHPNSVRTLVLRGVFSLNPYYFGRDTQRALDLVFEDCKNDPACNKTYPNLEDTLSRVLTRLDKSPASAFTMDTAAKKRIELRIDRNAFLGGIRRLLYDANTQQLIPLMIHKADHGNFQPMDDAIRSVNGILNGFSVGMFFSVACAEGISNKSIDEPISASQEKLYGKFMTEGAATACANWARGKLSKGYFKPVKSDAPVLILSGELDPVTPPSWGDKVQKTLPNSIHLRMKGIAHSPFPPCAEKIMADFVESGSPNGLDTACLKDLTRLPFVQPPIIEEFNTDSYDEESRELIKLENKWLAITAGADRDALNEFLPDDFEQIEISNGNSSKENKFEWVESVLRLTTNVHDGTFKLGSPKIEINGDRAVVNINWSLSGTINGRAVKNTIGVTDIWKKTEGIWKVYSRTIK